MWDCTKAVVAEALKGSSGLQISIKRASGGNEAPRSLRRVERGVLFSLAGFDIGALSSLLRQGGRSHRAREQAATRLVS